MIDFAIPGHHPSKANPANYIKPYKQPTSSMCPTIIVNKADLTVRLVIGASGGLKIISATSLVVIKHLWGDSWIDEAVKEPRLHVQLKPMAVEYEKNFPIDILMGLCHLGHKLEQLQNERPSITEAINRPVASGVNAISVDNGVIHAAADIRRRGFANGY